MNKIKKNPKVSVCVITYNQVNYIRQCLQSILDQVTDFDFEVIVGDDCSTDGTRAIVEEFAVRYPTVVRTIYQEKNTGGSKNNLDVHAAALGKYVAHVDGDDYCLPGKLQAQANYLNNNPLCNIVWHRMYALSPENTLYIDNFIEIGLVFKKYFLEDVICNITIGLHSSKMYRSTNRIKRLDNTNESDYLDFTINILQLNDTEKYACFVNETQYGVYRANIGISQQQNKKIKKLIYYWLHYFYINKIGNPSIICAKILWLIMSDIKHKKSSVFYGIKTFIRPIKSLKLISIISVRKKMNPALNMYKISKLSGKI